MRNMLALPIALAVCSVATVAQATTITVTTTSDDYTTNGNCTLREAIRAATSNAPRDACSAGAGDDVIVLGPLTYVLSVPGTDENQNATGDLDVSDLPGDLLTIRGEGMNRTTIDANGIDRVFNIPFSNARLRLEDLRITGGNTGGVSGFTGGGCLYKSQNSSELHLLRVIVGGCVSSGSSAGGGGLHVAGPLVTITDSIIRNNVASATAFQAQGGGINFIGTPLLRGVLITGNSAIGTTGALGGGVMARDPGVFINTTISGNQVSSPAGDVRGGGIYSSFGRLPELSACTISGNNAAEGGGIFSGNANDNTGPFLKSTIVAGNTASVSAPDIRGRVQSRGYLIVGDTSAATIDDAGNGNTAVGNLLNVDPLLGSLANNGGPSSTISFDSASPALDGGSCTDVAGLTIATDQRGVLRPSGSSCDVGALELSDNGGQLIETMVEPAGANCASGGQLIRIGVDSGAGGGIAANGTLESGEVQSSAYICAGESGTNSLIATTVLAVGDVICPDGGIRIDAGLDNGDGGGIADDGVLQSGEIDSFDSVCNGATSEATLVTATPIPVSHPACASGGIQIDLGIDNGDGGGTGNDGVLQSGEVDSTDFVCNGVVAPATLLVTTPLPAGDPNCVAGGVRIEVGIDNGDGGGVASDGVLQSGEIDETSFVCNGVDGANNGATLVTSTDLAEGDANCPNGGVQIDVGIDNGDGGETANDGILQPGEVDNTSYVCGGGDGVDGVDGADGTNGIDGEEGAPGEAGQTAATCSFGSPRRPSSLYLGFAFVALLFAGRRNG